MTTDGKTDQPTGRVRRYPAGEGAWIPYQNRPSEPDGNGAACFPSNDASGVHCSIPASNLATDKQPAYFAPQ